MGALAGKYRYVFFDADDTLWENEHFFREAEAQFAGLLAPYAPKDGLQKLLWAKQEDNIPYFGYGSKTYLIGMADAAMELCGGTLPKDIYEGIKKIIKGLAFHEFQLIAGVEETLKTLREKYILVCATKGDLVEQQYKYRRSGLDKYFHHIVVLENKSERDYLELCRMHNIAPSELLMIGNSVKSDIAPVVNIGGTAIHTPHEVIWVHEMMDMPENNRIFEVKCIKDVINLL